MTNLSKDLRGVLSKRWPSALSTTLASETESPGGDARKVVLTLSDGETVESVLLRRDRFDAGTLIGKGQLVELVAESKALDIDVVVMPFGQSSHLERDGIRYRTSDVEGGYWRNHLWPEPVGDMVRNAVQTEFARSGMFSRVLLIDEAGYAHAHVTGDVVRTGGDFYLYRNTTTVANEFIFSASGSARVIAC